MHNILAVGAHPDDLEVGCFGALLKHRQNGDKVHIAITTKGGYGNRKWQTIQNEFDKSIDILKPTSSIILNNKIGHIQMNWKTVSEIDYIIDKYHIDTIYTLWYGDSHQDHQTSFKIVMGACRRSRVDNIYCCELGNYVFHAQFAFRPQLFVDISDVIEDKINAISQYKTYFNAIDLSTIRNLAAFRGSNCNSKYAEAFEIIRQVRR